MNTKQITRTQGRQGDIKERYDQWEEIDGKNPTNTLQKKKFEGIEGRLDRKLEKKKKRKLEQNGKKIRTFA